MSRYARQRVDASRSRAATRSPSCSDTRSARVARERRFAKRASASGGRRRGRNTAIWPMDGARPRQPWASARRGRFDPRRDDARMGLCRYGHHGRRRRLERHLSDRRRRAGRIHPQRQPLALPVRRERGAARQVPRGARALPARPQSHRLRHGGAHGLQRPAGDVARRADGARPQPRRRQSGPVGEAGWRLQGR